MLHRCLSPTLSANHLSLPYVKRSDHTKLSQTRKTRQNLCQGRCVTVPPVFHQAFTSLPLAQIKSLISGTIRRICQLLAGSSFVQRLPHHPPAFPWCCSERPRMGVAAFTDLYLPHSCQLATDFAGMKMPLFAFAALLYVSQRMDTRLKH